MAGGCRRSPGSQDEVKPLPLPGLSRHCTTPPPSGGRDESLLRAWPAHSCVCSEGSLPAAESQGHPSLGGGGPAWGWGKGQRGPACDLCPPAQLQHHVGRPRPGRGPTWRPLIAACLSSSRSSLRLGSFKLQQCHPAPTQQSRPGEDAFPSSPGGRASQGHAACSSATNCKGSMPVLTPGDLAKGPGPATGLTDA